MVSEKQSPLQFGQEFVSEYYAVLKRAPETLQGFYGDNSSYVHGGLDSHGKPADAVYGQAEIHRKVMSHNFTGCRVEVLHVDAQATLSDGVVVQVLGLLAINNQALRRFVQTFVLAPQGLERKFYVHNDVLRYEDEVFEGFGTDLQELSKKEEEAEPEAEQEPVSEPREEKPDTVVEEAAPEATKKTPSTAPADSISEDPATTDPAYEDVRPISWVSVVCKKLGPVIGTPPPVVKEPPKPRPQSPIPTQKLQQDKREAPVNPKPPGANRPVPEAREQGHREPRRVVRHPDSHQLFLGNLPHDVEKSELRDLFQTFGTVVELRIHSGGELPNFGFVVFDNPAPVQRVLSKRPVLLRGVVRLNVQEKKPRAARKGDRSDNRLRGPGVRHKGLESGQRGLPRGDLMQQPDRGGVDQGLSPEQ